MGPSITDVRKKFPFFTPPPPPPPPPFTFAKFGLYYDPYIMFVHRGYPQALNISKTTCIQNTLLSRALGLYIRSRYPIVARAWSSTRRKQMYLAYKRLAQWLHRPGALVSKGILHKRVKITLLDSIRLIFYVA